jgi:hypothetical protein
VIGDALQVVDHKGNPHTPVGGPAPFLGRVDDEIQRLRVEQVHLVVGGLEISGALYVAGLQDVQALPENSRAPKDISKRVLSVSGSRRTSAISKTVAQMCSHNVPRRVRDGR